MWKSINVLISEIKRCEESGASIAALAMAFICIDTMTLLSLPENQSKQGGADFIRWVDNYLKGHDDQPYKYRGVDVYGARCSLLHSFSSEADYHHKTPDAKRFGYHDGGEHAYDPSVDETLVIIGTKSFINDVVIAIESFLVSCKSDQELRKRVEIKLERVMQVFRIDQSTSN